MPQIIERYTVYGGELYAALGAIESNPWVRESTKATAREKQVALRTQETSATAEIAVILLLLRAITEANINKLGNTCKPARDFIGRNSVGAILGAGGGVTLGTLTDSIDVVRSDKVIPTEVLAAYLSTLLIAGGFLGSLTQDILSKRFDQANRHPH